MANAYCFYEKIHCGSGDKKRWRDEGMEAQSNELTRGPPELISALSFIGGDHIGARGLHVLNLKWFGYIARLSQWEGGGNFLVQMISTCLRYA
jgi:hypothetical protein